jgi:hypothetical protein
MENLLAKNFEALQFVKQPIGVENFQKEKFSDFT